MAFGFKAPVIRSARSRLVDATKTAADVTGSVYAFIKTRTFARSLYICISMAIIVFTVYNTKIVQVIDGGSSKYIYTFRTNPVSILKQGGITLTAQDQYEFSNFKNNSATINFFQAFPVKITVDNSTKNLYMAKGTISDVLQKANVTLGDYDQVNYPLEQSVTPGTDVVIQRVNYKTVTENNPIAYPTTTVPTTLLRKNASQVLVAGKDGVQQTIYQEKFVDGKVVDQQVVSQTVVSQPVTCQMLVGTAANTPISQFNPPSGFSLSANGTPVSYKRVIHGTATAYSAVDGKYTAVGKYAQVGYVAVDPRVIPLGSTLYIMQSDGSFVYGVAKAYDTGGFAYNGSGIDVDLYFNTTKEVSLFGRRSVDIYVIN